MQCCRISLNSPDFPDFPNSAKSGRIASRRRTLALPGTAFLLLLVGSAITAPAARAQSTLWYTGDLFGQNALINRIAGADPARAFDNFTVTDPIGWRITSVFSNNIFSGGFFGGPPNFTQADWSIRTGLSAGNGGTIVAGGVGTATKTDNNRTTNFLYEEYRVEVSGLSVILGPGTYWLNVTPVFSGESYNTTTTGANGVGTPRNDGNAFLDRPSNGTNFQSQGTANFSMGVRGVSLAPEPGSLALVACGALSLVGIAVRRRRTKRTARG
jgi:hypothetical protein